MMNSAVFHTFICHSKVTFNLLIGFKLSPVLPFSIGSLLFLQALFLLIAFLLFLLKCFKETKQQLLQCDHGGILLAFLGTYVRIIVTTLRCFPGQRSLHLTIVCLLFGTVLAIKYGPGKAGTKVCMCHFNSTIKTLLSSFGLANSLSF